MLEMIQASFSSAIMENFYSMITMAAGYLLLCVALPALCLRKFVADKDLAYRLVFYQVWGMLYLIAIGFLLAFTHLYSAVSLWLLLIIVPVGIRAWIGRNGIKAWFMNLVLFGKRVSEGAYNSLRMRKSLGRWIKEHAGSFWKKYLKGHLITFLVWAALLVFSVAYFGYFKLHYCSYAMTDEETHLYWIQSLVDNNAFPAGMYPYGEHFFVGAVVSLFNVQVARNWLAFAMVSTISIFLAAYLFFRRIFSSRAAVLFAFGVFVIMDLTITTTYFRYQYSLPMEFALGAMFFTFFALAEYLKTKSRIDLFLFGGGLALTFEIHFYVTIFTIMLLVGYAIVLAIPAFRKKVLHKIVICAVVSMILAAAPFAIGFACGFTFERSISWAVEIAQGGDGSASLQTTSSDSSDSSDTSSSSSLTDSTSSDDDEEETEEEASIREIREQALAIRTPADLLNFIATLLSEQFSSSFEIAQVTAGLALAVCLYGILGILWCTVRKKKEDVLRFQIFLAYGASWLAGFIVYSSSSLGLPQIVHSVRAAIFLSVYSVGLYALPIQIVYDALAHLPVKERRIDVVLCVACAALFAGLCQVAPLKSISHLYYDFAIQSADMYVCEKLMDENEDHTWTVVSPVNDLSAIRSRGYHYEIVDLMEEIEKGETEIYIPTPDIAVVVENPVVSYGTGDQRQVDGSDFSALTIPISPTAALQTYEDLGLSNLASRDRAYYDLRQQTMSKIYYWMEKIKQVYPSETTIYYQDEYCTVYHIQQDPYFLLNLAVDYTDVIEAAIESEASEGGSND